MDIKSMILSEVCDLDFKDFATQKFLGTASELQEMTISNSQDDVFALGKNEAKLSALSKNKATKLSGTSGQWEQFLMGLQTGSGVIVGEADIEKSEILVVADNSVKIKYKTKAITGLEVLTANENVDLTKSLTSGLAVGVGVYTFADDTGVITFNTDELEDGTMVRATYNTTATDANKVSNDTRKFSKIVSITGNTIVVDGCEEKEYLAQLVIPKAKISGSFDIKLGGEPAVQSFEIEALTGCGNTKLWDLIITEDEDLEVYS